MGDTKAALPERGAAPFPRLRDRRRDVAKISEIDQGETYAKARLESLRSAMESAKDAIKACLLINGGAAGGLLAFMGHLATVGNDRLIRGLLVSLLLFGGGLITAIIAHGTAYASHLNYAFCDCGQLLHTAVREQVLPTAASAIDPRQARNALVPLGTRLNSGRC